MKRDIRKLLKYNRKFGTGLIIPVDDRVRRRRRTRRRRRRRRRGRKKKQEEKKKIENVGTFELLGLFSKETLAQDCRTRDCSVST
jgi:hypothetical protein